MYDDDALRFVDFANELAHKFGTHPSTTTSSSNRSNSGQEASGNGLEDVTENLYHKVAEFLRNKKPGQVSLLG